MTSATTTRRPSFIGKMRLRRSGGSGRSLLLAPAVLLLCILFVAPMIIFFRYSVYTFYQGQLNSAFSWGAFKTFFGNGYYAHLVVQTILMGVYCTVITTVLAYPYAYFMWRIRSGLLRGVLGLVIFVPLTITTVVRSYGWQTLLTKGGYIEQVFGSWHPLIFNMTGVVISLAQINLPFMVFPIYAALTRMDPSLREAASDLGAGWLRTLLRVSIPMSLTGALAGAQLTLALLLGAFVTPSLLGGGRVQILPLDIYDNAVQINWPLASVESIWLLVITLLALYLFRLATRTWERGLT